MKIAKANGIQIAYDSFGLEGDEAILLIAGLGSQMIRWAVPFCEELAARGYHVIRFDNRDAGLSTHLHCCPAPDFRALAAALDLGRQPDVPYSLNDMALDAIGLLDTLGVGRAHVVGRSMGGMIAQILACEHPERVLSLTSIMSSTGNPKLPQAAPDVLEMMMRPAPHPVSDELGFVTQSLAFARRLAGQRSAFNDEAYRLLILEEARRGYDPEGTSRQIAAMATAGDRRSRLAGITAPTVVIHGADDPLILPACGKDTAASIPNAKIIMIEGMGHDLPTTFFEEVAGAIEETARRGGNG